jgi:hypothetical protein
MPTERKAKTFDTKSSDSKRKSEVVTVRLDPKLKYVAELAARRQRRTLSSYIEWAIEDSLSRVHPAYEVQGEMEPTFADKASSLWDVDEADRFARLALNYSDLLDHEEQRVWKLVRECGALWRGGYRTRLEDWTWKVSEETLDWKKLREHWETFRQVASGKQPMSALPKWQKTKSQSKNDLDDEIPF